MNALVAAAGRLAQRSNQDEPLPEAIRTAFRDLWQVIRDTVRPRGPKITTALSAFGWWVNGDLAPEWTVPELVSLMEVGVNPDPDFGVLAALPSTVDSQPELTMRALELIVASHGERWRFHAHEADIRAVLERLLREPPGELLERAVTMVHALGGLGMLKLGELLGPDDIGSAGSDKQPASGPA